ncbi:MAG: hypothetical protein KW804_02300 [Candidatus Doudnabacteria bacterium]|nr:hypothetical protein [Candidatus Doudnabacteria bacterium]
MAKDFIEKFAEGQRESKTNYHGYLLGPRQVTKLKLKTGFIFIIPLLLISLYALVSAFTMESWLVKATSVIVLIVSAYLLHKIIRRSPR